MSARAIALTLVLAAGPAGAQHVRDALEAGELICEFREGFRHSLIAELTGERSSDLLLVYEAVKADSAEVISSASPGRKPVRVRATDKAVHLIHFAGPSVRVTTLTSCRKWRWKGGVETCVRFAARHAWHFDALALKDPDETFAKLPSGASTGACEPWRID